VGFLACIMAVLWLPVAAARAEPADLDLLGTWYVVIHYTDSSTANPQAERWADLVWVLSMKGSRLEWQEYPLVVFSDTSGRFEAIPGNPRARTLRAWEPNSSQLAMIDRGPRINTRGAKTKTLKGSAQSGWASVNRMGGMTSASVMGYQESLAIEQPDSLPRFVRADSVGNAYKQSGGQNVYETTEVRDGGDTLIGRYERDGHRQGTFRARRTPPPRGLPKKEGTPNERLAEKLRASGGIGAMGLGQSSGGPREGFDEGDDF